MWKSYGTLCKLFYQSKIAFLPRAVRVKLWSIPFMNAYAKNNKYIKLHTKMMSFIFINTWNSNLMLGNLSL